MHEAAFDDDDEEIAELAASGSDVFCVSSTGASPLLVATRHGCERAVRKLLDLPEGRKQVGLADYFGDLPIEKAQEDTSRNRSVSRMTFVQTQGLDVEVGKKTHLAELLTAARFEVRGNGPDELLEACHCADEYDVRTVLD